MLVFVKGGRPSYAWAMQTHVRAREMAWKSGVLISAVNWFDCIRSGWLSVRCGRWPCLRWRWALLRTRQMESSEKSLARICDVIACRSRAFLNPIVHKIHKTFNEGDIEISEAVDFDEYYSMLTGKIPELITNFWNYDCGSSMALSISNWKGWYPLFLCGRSSRYC